MSNYIVNGIVKQLPPNPKSTIGLTQLKKIFKQVLDELNVAYADECCLTDATTFTLRNNDGALETLNDAGEWVAFTLESADGLIVPYYPTVTQNDIAAGTGGAIIVTNYLTTINTDAGGDAFTLADGVQVGQVKKILLVVDGGGNATITPANLSGGTTITMNDAADYVVLIWNGTDWVVIENSGATIA